MPLCKPRSLDGASMFWTTIIESQCFEVQEHKIGGPFWFGEPYRILLKNSRIVIATAPTKPEIEKDWIYVIQNFYSVCSTAAV